MEWRETRIAFELLRLAENESNPALQEFAVWGLATYHTKAGEVGHTTAGVVVPLLLRMLTAPLFSDASINTALAFLARITSFKKSLDHVEGVFSLETGAVPQVLAVLRSGARSERLALADAALAGLLKTNIVLQGKVEGISHLELVTAVLTTVLSLSDISPAGAGIALRKLAEFVDRHDEPAADAVFRRLGVPAALIGGILWAAGAGAAAAQRAQRARAALCGFVARSPENGKAVYRQGGVPVLVETLLLASAEEDRRMAAAALQLMETKGGAHVCTAIQEARERLDAARSATQDNPQGTSQTHGSCLGNCCQSNGIKPIIQFWPAF